MTFKRFLRGSVLLCVVVAGALVIRRIPPTHGAASRPHPSLQQSPPMSSDVQGRRPNRLLQEKSPYLLQHAYNPVDWYPWGEEAFAKATRDDKPIFLSIGYSTCYWCHVMEKESFENPQIAALMNEQFVSIKVDREERPDLDAIYMSAVQALSGQGGWPMSVFLTPEGKPFWGGTYFPPEDKWGRPGFTTVLSSIAQAWRTKRQDILHTSDAMTKAIQAGAHAGPTAALTTQTLELGVEQFAQQFDSIHGGFGSAPKFPRSHGLSFLLRGWSRSRDPKTLAMVEATLEAMARGGIHDQLGGGFHRYSTDAQWLVPHFEKMLYDQALLARTYLEAYQVTGKPPYADVARDIFEYVLRDMQDPKGGFYSAEDAGEVGKEGEWYVWTPKEIEQELGKPDAELVSRLYGITPQGNFSADHASGGSRQRREGGSASGGERGTTILSLAVPLETFAAQEHLSVEALCARIEPARARLLAARNRRPRPHRDDKILTDWNGLMIGALAYGARVLDEPRYAQAAEGAATFILTRLQRGQRLLHRYRDGAADIPAFLDDYAGLSWGLLELYEATGEPRWLSEAQRLTKEMVRLFWDDSGGGFWLTGSGNERLIAQTKELYDGAMPSGNSIAALTLVRLGRLTMDEDLQRRAQRIFETFSGQVGQAPQAFPQLLIALDAWLGPAQEIVVAGDPSAPDTQQMLQTIRHRFLPRAVLALHPTDPAAAKDIERLSPFITAQRPLEGRATAYVCQNYVCNLPVSDPAKLTSLLDRLQ